MVKTKAVKGKAKQKQKLKPWRPKMTATTTKERKNARPGRKIFSELYDAMCHLCGKNFPDVQTKDKHAAIHSTPSGPGKKTCQCGEIFPTAGKDFYRHFLGVHTGHSFHCLVKRCGKGFTDKKCTVDHHYTQHELSDYTKNPRKYESETETVRENLTGAASEKYKRVVIKEMYKVMCALCGRKKQTKAECVKHESRHHKVTESGKYKCENCGEKFALLWRFVHHYHRKHSSKDFRCFVEDCGRRYGSRDDVIKHHIKRHTLDDYEPNYNEISILSINPDACRKVKGQKKSSDADDSRRKDKKKADVAKKDTKVKGKEKRSDHKKPSKSKTHTTNRGKDLRANTGAGKDPGVRISKSTTDLDQSTAGMNQGTIASISTADMDQGTIVSTSTADMEQGPFANTGTADMDQGPIANTSTADMEQGAIASTSTADMDQGPIASTSTADMHQGTIASTITADMDQGPIASTSTDMDLKTKPTVEPDNMDFEAMDITSPTVEQETNRRNDSYNIDHYALPDGGSQTSGMDEETTSFTGLTNMTQDTMTYFNSSISLPVDIDQDNFSSNASDDPKVAEKANDDTPIAHLDMNCNAAAPKVTNNNTLSKATITEAGVDLSSAEPTTTEVIYGQHVDGEMPTMTEELAVIPQIKQEVDNKNDVKELTNQFSSAGNKSSTADDPDVLQAKYVQNTIKEEYPVGSSDAVVDINVEQEREKYAKISDHKESVSQRSIGLNKNINAAQSTSMGRLEHRDVDEDGDYFLGTRHFPPC